jgi:hypothetical protein
MKPLARCLLVVVLLVPLFVSGCSHRITQNTPYYAQGFDQLDPPEGELAAGTHVLKIAHKGSYARVLTPDLKSVWVWDRTIESVWAPREKPDETESNPPAMILEARPEEE